MAIVSIGQCTALGVVDGTPAATVTVNTNATIEAGNVILLLWSGNNSSASDGDNNEHSSVTDSSGAVSWTKIGEYTNSGGAADAGVTTSLWYRPKQAGDLASGSAIICTRTDARADQVAYGWEYSCATELRRDAAAVGTEVNGANDFGSAALSSLPSVSRLYIRALGKEANVASTNNLTPSTDFNAMANGRSRNNAASICLRGEYRINTSTGETSNPTFAFSGDTASVFAGLVETIVATAAVGALVATGFAPTVTASNNQTASAGVGALVLAGLAPTVSVSNHQTVSTALGALVLTGFEPSVTASNHQTVATDLGTLQLDGFAPTVTATAGTTALTATGQLVLAGLAPSVAASDNIQVATALGTLSLTGFAPSVATPVTVSTGLGALVLAGLSPSVLTPVSVTPDLGALVLAGYAPTVSVAGGAISVTPGVGALLLNAFEPSVYTSAKYRWKPSTPSAPTTTGAPHRWKSE